MKYAVIYDSPTGNTKILAEEIRKYVDENRSYVLLTIAEGEATKVVFKDGQVVTVKRNKTDDFDLNKAVYAAMIKKGFEGI